MKLWITSKEDIDEIVKEAEDLGAVGVWIDGISEENDSGLVEFRLISGENFDYAFWHDGESSNYSDGHREPNLILTFGEKRAFNNTVNDPYANYYNSYYDKTSFVVEIIE